MGAAKVLLIENNARDAAQILDGLNALGVPSVYAEDGAMGMALLELNQPVMVIIADELPGMSGYVVCKQIKQHATLSGVSVVMTSRSDGAAQMFAQHARYKTRAEDYIIKPLTVARLDALLRSHHLIEGDAVDEFELVEGVDEMELLEGDALVDDGGDIVLMDSVGIEALEEGVLADLEPLGVEMEVVETEDIGLEEGDFEVMGGVEEMMVMEEVAGEFSGIALMPDLDPTLPELPPASATLEIDLDDDDDSPFSALPSSEHILDEITAGLEFEALGAPAAELGGFDREEQTRAVPASETEQEMLRVQVRSMRRELARVGPLQREQERLEARLRELEKERDALRDVGTTHQQTIRRLREECDTLRDIEATQQEAIERLRDERDDLQKRLDRIGQKMAGERDSSARVAELEHEVHSLTVRLDFARDEHEQAMDQLRRRHEEEFKQTRQQLALVSGTSEQAQQQLEELRAGLAQQLGQLDAILQRGL